MKTYTATEVAHFHGRKIKVAYKSDLVATFRTWVDGAMGWEAFKQGLRANGDRLVLVYSNGTSLVIVGDVGDLDDSAAA